MALRRAEFAREKGAKEIKEGIQNQIIESLVDLFWKRNERAGKSATKTIGAAVAIPLLSSLTASEH